MVHDGAAGAQQPSTREPSAVLPVVVSVHVRGARPEQLLQGAVGTMCQQYVHWFAGYHQLRSQEAVAVVITALKGLIVAASP